jgi:hypothetical protein
MKRLFPVVLALAMVSVGVATRADVKTQERTKATFEGMLGKMVGLFGGKSAKEGIVSTVAVKGDRMMKVTDTTGQIIDLAEEKVYDLDMKKKTYKVTTFEELRRQMEEARKKAEAQMKEEREEPEQGEAPEMEIDFDVKQTGQTKTIAGHATQEIVVTITTRQKGKTLEEGGGMVLATNSWLATDVPELKEIQNFHARYAQKLGDVLAGGASAQQMAAAMAMFPGMKAAMERMQQENVKVEGSPLASTMVMESVKSADEMAAAQKSESGGGGLGGMLARKMTKKADPTPRSKVMTTESETLSIATAVADTDVAIPAGFKEKK